VGESGSGKTTVGKAVLQLLRDTAQISGEALLDGRPLRQLHGDRVAPQGARRRSSFRIRSRP
jgi:peptide/nickel transport system ATP-binding protein